VSNLQPIAFLWRREMLNDTSLAAATKHVLQTLQSYMQNDTGKAYPSIATLSKDTGYSEKSVGTHIGIGVERGWLRVTKKGKDAGQKWNQNIYFPSFPNKAPESASAASMKQMKINAIASVNNGSKDLNQIPTNSINNSLNNYGKDKEENLAEFRKAMKSIGVKMKRKN
jgi:DNA-binding transcriptional MocR family regulator